MAQIVTWRGASGNSYDFEIYPDGQTFNPVSAVYTFCRNISPDSWQAIYVGETGSLRQRLNMGISAHEGYARAKQLSMTHIGVMLVHGDGERLRVETDLRNGLLPAANAQGVSGRVA